MRNLILVGASALVLALGVAQASAAGQSRNTNADLFGQPVATSTTPSNASSFEAHEYGEAATPVVHSAGR